MIRDSRAAGLTTARPRRWRCGESNPGPSILRRRLLRAQPTASLRLAGLHRRAAGRPIPNQSRPPGPGTPADPSCSTTFVHQGQEPLRRTGYLFSGSQCKLWSGTYGCCRIFNEDSGDLGSLPTPRLSTSKPVHPQGDAHILHQPCDNEARRPKPPGAGPSGGRLSGRSSRRPRPGPFRLRSWRRPRPGRGRRPGSRGAPPSVSWPPPGR